MRNNAKPDQRSNRRFFWIALVAGIVVGVASAAIMQNLWWPHGRTRLLVKSRVKDAGGLHRGAPVRLAGVDIGYVKTVEAQPENREYPGYIELAITAPYQLSIPHDSLVAVKAAGFLRGSYVEIDVSDATGPAIADGEFLPSVSKEALTPERTLELMESLKKMQEKADQQLPAEESHSKATVKSKAKPK